MLRHILHSQIAKLEQTYDYDGTYMHDVLNSSVPAFLKFSLFQLMSVHRRNVPKEAWFGARIAAAMSEDCGPCTQLIVDMAVRSGVSKSALAAAIKGDSAMVDSDIAFGFRYGKSIACNSADATDLVAEARQRYGDRGLVSLAFAVATARVYPTLKRGMGHAVSCTRIRIGPDQIVPAKAA